VLRAEVGRRGWKREGVAIGAATDPYQPAEGTYKLTRACLEVLGRAATPFSIVTRGPMIVRDVDVLADAAAKAEVQVNFSVPTLDVDIWRKTEPGTAPPRQRLRALEKLVASGINAGVGMAPLLPGLSDRPELLREVVAAARQAGACFLWANVLYLRPGTREHFLEVLSHEWPEQLPAYLELYQRRAYLDEATKAPALTKVSDLRAEYGIDDRRHVALNPAPPAIAEQLLLFA